MDKKTAATKCEKQRNLSKRGLSAQYENTDSAWSFYNGDQMTYTDDIMYMNSWGRPANATVSFNKVQPIIDAVVGFAAQNRRQAKFTAHLPNDERQALYSRNTNAIYTYTRENTNADYLESDQDLDMVVAGYGAIETDLSYMAGNATTMPNGEIVKLKLDTKCVGWDPKATGKNLLDARWSYYYQDYDLQEALELFEGSDAEDFEQVSDSDSGNTGYKYNPWGGIYSKIKMEDSVEWAAKDQEMVRVYNHQWFEYETFYKAKNPLYSIDDPEIMLYAQAKMDVFAAEIKGDYPEGVDGRDMFDFDPSKESITFDGPTKAKLVKEFGDMIDPVPFKRKVFYTAVYSGKHVFSVFKSVSQQGFSIKFKTGTYNQTAKFWMGMVNGMMEPQKYYNKALTELMFTIAANSKGGVYVEEDAVEDIADFEANYARTDAVMVVKPGTIANKKIQDKARPQVPTGLESIITLSEQGINSQGVDPSFMGDLRGGEEQAASLYKRRIRQIISKFARYFDSISLYQKEDARLCADLMRVWVENNEGEWIPITGPDGAEEFMQLTADLFTPEYSVSIQEAPQTPEDDREQSAGLMAMGDKLMALGDPAGKAFIIQGLRKSGMDGEMLQSLTKALEGQEPNAAQLQAQLQAATQQIQQLTQLIQSGEVEKNMATAEKDRAMAAKTMSEVPINQAKVPNTQADTALKLEQSQKTAVESAVMVVNPDREVQVNV